MAALPLTAELRTGPDPIESEPIGSLASAGVQDDIFEFTFRLDFRGFDWTNSIAVYLPDIAPALGADEQARLAEARVAGFLSTLERTFPRWFQDAVTWDDHVRSLADADFLRWLETRKTDIPALLGVPAVRERIAMLRDRDAKTRRTLAVRLAKLIAGVTEGRPRVPPDEVLYHDVRHASEFLQPLYQVLREAAENPTTDRTAWRRFESQNKRLAELVSALGLREKWFAWGTLRSGSASASARRSSRRKDATLLSLAYEFVAARYRMKASTVEKHVQAVNSRRRPRKIRGPKFRVKWTRDNSA